MSEHGLKKLMHTFQYEGGGGGKCFLALPYKELQGLQLQGSGTQRAFEVPDLSCM